MHLDILREVAREDFSDQEAIVEGAAHVFDRVTQVEGLDPFKDLTGESSGCGILRRHRYSCCHIRTKNFVF